MNKTKERMVKTMDLSLKHLDLMKHAITRKAYLTPREEDAAELELLHGWMEGSAK